MNIKKIKYFTAIAILIIAAAGVIYILMSKSRSGFTGTSASSCPTGMNMYMDDEGRFFCSDGTYDPVKKVSTDYSYICGLNGQTNMKTCDQLYKEQMDAAQKKCPNGFTAYGSVADTYCCENAGILRDPTNPTDVKCQPHVQSCHATGANGLKMDSCDKLMVYSCPTGYSPAIEEEGGKYMKICKNTVGQRCYPDSTLESLGFDPTVTTPQMSCAEVTKANCPTGYDLIYNYERDAMRKRFKIKVCQERGVLNSRGRRDRCAPQGVIDKARTNYGADFTNMKCGP